MEKIIDVFRNLYQNCTTFVCLTYSLTISYASSVLHHNKNNIVIATKITDPENSPKNFKLFQYTGSNSAHAKIYLFLGDGFWAVITGSSNFTKSGFEENIESFHATTDFTSVIKNLEIFFKALKHTKPFDYSFSKKEKMTINRENLSCIHDFI